MSKSDVKDFLDEWKALDDMTKDDRTNLLYDNLKPITDFYVSKSRSTKEGHRKLIAQIFKRMESITFAKTLKRIVKSIDAEEITIDVRLVILLTDFIVNISRNGFKSKDADEEVIDIYAKVIDTILATPIKKLSKKVNLDVDTLKELLVVIPDPDLLTEVKDIEFYLKGVTRKIYAITTKKDLELDSDTLRTMFSKLFGEDALEYIAVYILLERRSMLENLKIDSQKSAWNALTTFALDQLEGKKKKAIAEMLQYYVEQRQADNKKDRDEARRISLIGIAEDTYPKISAVVDVLSEKDKVAKYL